MSEYKGVIVEESLKDNRILNDFKIIEFRISKEENPAERWHLYTVQVSKEDIVRLSKNIKQKWYMHFWKDGKMIVLFKGKKFILDVDNKDTWDEAIKYGLSINIPREQLDFEMEF